MKISRKYRVLYICIVMLLVSQFEVKAETKTDFSDFTAGGDIEDESINAKVDVDKTQDTLTISFQTMGIAEEEYHTITAFKSEELELEKGSSVRIQLQNKRSTAAKMNFDFVDEEGNAYQVSDGCYVMLIDDESATAKVENGSFEIPGNFSGEVEILLESMSAVDDSEQNCGTELFGYGFVCVSEGGNEYQVEFQNIEFLSEEEALKSDTLAELVIEGEETVRKPEVGKSKAYYSCYALDMLGNRIEEEYVLSMSEEVADATFTEDGWLEIGSETESEKICLRAETVDGTLQAEKIIALENSWTTSVLTEAGYDASVANPEEIAPIINTKVWNALDIFMWVIRIGSAVGVIVFFVYYYQKRKRRDT